MKPVVFTLALLCALNSAFAQQCVIKGRLQHAAGDSLYLLFNDGRRTDTVGIRVKNREFTFRRAVKTVEDATLIGHSIHSRSSYTFYAEPGTVHLSGSLDSIDALRATGTPNNDFQLSEQAREAVLNKKVLAFRSAGDRASADKVFADILQGKAQFIRQHPSALHGLTHLWVLSTRVPLDTALALYALMPPEVQQHRLGRQIGQQLGARDRARAGKPAPLFNTVDKDGNKVDLAALRGRYVLLDFWASWCVPCRAENPHLVAAYKQYKDKGFTIISVSLDHDRNKWLEAIQKDQLNWTHVSSLKWLAEPLAQLYGVAPIPANFLIGPDGVIKATGLRGAELESTLSRLMQ